jgi:hypothetical protein
MIESFKEELVKFVLRYFLEKDIPVEAFEVDLDRFHNGDYHITIKFRRVKK